MTGKPWWLLIIETQECMHNIGFVYLSKNKQTYGASVLNIVCLIFLCSFCLKYFFFLLSKYLVSYTHDMPRNVLGLYVKCSLKLFGLKENWNDFTILCTFLQHTRKISWKSVLQFSSSCICTYLLTDRQM